MENENWGIPLREMAKRFETSEYSYKVWLKKYKKESFGGAYCKNKVIELNNKLKSGYSIEELSKQYGINKLLIMKLIKKLDN